MSRLEMRQSSPLGMLVKRQRLEGRLASILGSSGKLDEAAKEKERLNAKAPGLMQTVGSEVRKRLQRSEDQERFFAGLRAAGVVIDALPPS
ncbi:hypothetical protein [Sinorhizobium mexicanum]|uniref:Uncharacterized protein n=1 Tax=Sinorhizobium mexicanum TaxID=375549 RepID=A0A859QYI1_9HYPH|nr:hypothetical protein [Sinorhizobium mexicanum]MBP1884561.1 hypothetical protein [Sinorhizobium mexicanum]QLL65466.1 hypothetical protein FKV68_29510 [Sinorhizobium mexicanum]